jgi:hypothetical protein
MEVWVTAEEREQISTRAKQAGLSQSAFLRATGLNQPIRSVYDLLAVKDLGIVSGDLGRVAGLLKLWLTDHRGFGAAPTEVEKTVKDLRALQTQLSELMRWALR